MKIELGPVLHFESCDELRWSFSVHVMVRSTAAGQAPPLELRVTGAKAGALELVADFTDVARLAVWCWRVDAPRGPAQGVVSYAITGSDATLAEVTDVAVPSTKRLPRIAFFSCNGFSSAELARTTRDPLALWRAMLDEHRKGLAPEGLRDPNTPSAVHLLLGGGDQVYADSLDVLRELDTLCASALKKKASSAKRHDDALKQYLQLYAARWSEPELAAMLARVPCALTWDDHDIFDGWGSHDERVQGSAAYGDVYRAAREAFRALQLGGGRGGRAPSLVHPSLAAQPEGPFLQTLELTSEGEALSIVMLDARSQRTPDEVLGKTQWDVLGAQLRRAKDPARTSHTVVVSSIPVVHLRYKAVSWILERAVPGAQEIEDDLRDQWEHPAHLGERARLIHTLLRHQHDQSTRVTILSGDVHTGALGCIESTRGEHAFGGPLEVARITQLTSSGIVHPSPSSWQRWFLELLGAEGRNEVDPGVVTSMLHLDSRTERLWSRNFLLIDLEPERPSAPVTLWARFVSEDRTIGRLVTVPSPRTEVSIHRGPG